MKVALVKHLQASVMIHLVYAVGFRENSIQNLNPVFLLCFPHLPTPWKYPVSYPCAVEMFENACAGIPKMPLTVSVWIHALSPAGALSLIFQRGRQERRKREIQCVEAVDLSLGCCKYFISLCRKLTSVNVQTAGYKKKKKIFQGKNAIGVTYPLSQSSTWSSGPPSAHKQI